MPLFHSRIRRSQRISPRKIVNHLNIATAEEVDEQVEAWLEEAYRRSLEGEGE